jgi:hypothetical protein
VKTYKSLDQSNCIDGNSKGCGVLARTAIGAIWMVVRDWNTLTRERNPSENSKLTSDASGRNNLNPKCGDGQSNIWYNIPFPRFRIGDHDKEDSNPCNHERIPNICKPKSVFRVKRLLVFRKAAVSNKVTERPSKLFTQYRPRNSHRLDDVFTKIDKSIGFKHLPFSKCPKSALTQQKANIVQSGLLRLKVETGN